MSGETTLLVRDLVGGAFELQLLPDPDAAAPQVGACPACQRAFTARQWACLPWLQYTGAVRSGGRVRAVEVRRCICDAPIGLEVDVPLARPVRP